MILLVVRLALPLLGSTLAGWLFVRRIWPDVRSGLGLALGAVFGSGYAGTTYFLVLSLFDCSSWSFAASEFLTAAAIVGLLVTRPRAPRKQSLGVRLSTSVFVWPLGVVAILAASSLVFWIHLVRYGAWDSFAIWNLKGRFLLLSSAPFLDLFDVASANPDYPLLLPSLLARGWRYAGSDILLVPMIVAGFFTVTVGIVTFTGLRMVTTASQSCVAACILLGTPFFFIHGASQYADIVMCCFITTAVVLYCIHEVQPLQHYRLPLLAGAAASFAACTKDEGILFLAVLISTRILLGLVRKTYAASARELLYFGGGSLFGLVAILAFKMVHSPSNGVASHILLHNPVDHLKNLALHINILKGFRHDLKFGEWTVNPLPWMAAHIAVSWKQSSGRRKIRAWCTPALVVAGMLAGYYMIYLLSPYEVDFYIPTTLDRLTLQIWPVLIIAYSMIVAPLPQLQLK